MCYAAIMRPGRTRTTSFSLDDATLKNLRALAARRHKGNVSALLAEFAERAVKLLAGEWGRRSVARPVKLLAPCVAPPWPMPS